MLRFGNILSGQVSAAIFAIAVLGMVPGTGIYAPAAKAAIRPAQAALSDDNWKIYCAGSAPTNVASDQTASDPALFFALRLRDNEVTSRKNTPCLTEQLTVSFVANWVRERILGKSQFISFNLPLQIDGRFRSIGFSFSTNDSDSRDQERRLIDMQNDCDVDQKPNEFGLFRIYGKNETCQSYPARSATNSVMAKLYAMNAPGDITHLTCYKACIMSINFNDRIVKLIFHKKRMPAWQQIRREALAVLSRRVVLNYEPGKCRGDLCDALMLELH